MIASLEKSKITSIPTFTDIFHPTLSMYSAEYYLLKITYHNGDVENKVFTTILERDKEYNKLKRGIR